MISGYPADRRAASSGAAEVKGGKAKEATRKYKINPTLGILNIESSGGMPSGRFEVFSVSGGMPNLNSSGMLNSGSGGMPKEVKLMIQRSTFNKFTSCHKSEARCCATVKLKHVKPLRNRIKKNSVRCFINRLCILNYRVFIDPFNKNQSFSENFSLAPFRVALSPVEFLPLSQKEKLAKERLVKTKHSRVNDCKVSVQCETPCLPNDITIAVKQHLKKFSIKNKKINKMNTAANRFN